MAGGKAGKGRQGRAARHFSYAKNNGFLAANFDLLLLLVVVVSKDHWRAHYMIDCFS